MIVVVSYWCSLPRWRRAPVNSYSNYKIVVSVEDICRSFTIGVFIHVRANKSSAPITSDLNSSTERILGITVIRS
jgi:hypothetical protein